MLKPIITIIALLGFATLVACSPNGSAEKSGERMDSAIEEATQGQIDRGDGPMENAGEALDQATGSANTDPVDAMHDATDNNPSTTP